MFEKYFSILDILIGLIWFGILFGIVTSQSKLIENPEIRVYYVRNFLFKVFFALFYTIAYYFILGGGDTRAYWDGTVVLNKLFFRDVGLYLEHLQGVPNDYSYIKHFNIETGFPPGWIFREEQGWFVCKLTSFVSIFALRSLPATLVIYAFLISRASFAVFDIVIKVGLHKTRTAAWCVLFIPSVAFWCTGISKDAVMFWAILSLVAIFLNFLIFKASFNFSKIIFVAFLFFLIINIRSFTIAAVLVPLAIAFSARFTKTFSSSIARTSFRVLIVGVGFVGFIFIGSSSYLQELTNEASIIQKDFANNPIYTGKRYNIDVTDPSPVGMLRAFPISVFYGVYAPLIYDALSATLIFNGIESTILIFMTLNFLFNGNVLKKIKWISKSEFLVFSFVFILLIGFMAGYTSVLYGVLVRIRAPLLPFIFLIFTTRSEKQIEDDKLVSQT
jgi:hypothetical protein